MNIREEFKDHVSKSAFVNIDGVTRIVGKFGEIEIIDDVFDIWFANRENPLSQRKITALLNKIDRTEGVSVANGEIWYQVKDKNEVLSILSIMGVKKRKRYSEETLEKMREQGRKAIKSIRK